MTEEVEKNIERTNIERKNIERKNIERVTAFNDAWTAMDLSAVLAAFAEDIVYHNIPMAPVSGGDTVRAYLQGAWQFDECCWTLHTIAGAGEFVLTEREDAFRFGAHWVRLPVMGTFRLRDGLITEWRDYFDLADYQKQLAAAGLG